MSELTRGANSEPVDVWIAIIRVDVPNEWLLDRYEASAIAWFAIDTEIQPGVGGGQVPAVAGILEAPLEWCMSTKGVRG
jgi:hypothetical protein